MNRLILYASYQKGRTLSGYVKFALKQLSSLGKVVLITNERILEPGEIEFLNSLGIALFLTENKGFDFGMWFRYLKSRPLSVSEGTRLVLMNDSIVYYKKCLAAFFEKAEQSKENVVSLTENDEGFYHLQSFFLFFKGESASVLTTHLNEIRELNSFYEVVTQGEMALTKKLQAEGFSVGALFKTQKPILYSYPELISSGAGFVKRKLLQHRFTWQESKHFCLHGEQKALFENYQKLIEKVGKKDTEFLSEYFPESVHSEFYLWILKFSLFLFVSARKIYKKI